MKIENEKWNEINENKNKKNNIEKQDMKKRKTKSE